MDISASEEEERIFCPLEIEKWKNCLIRLKFGNNEPVSFNTYSLIGYMMMFVFYRITMENGDLYTNMYSLIHEKSRKETILAYLPIIAVPFLFMLKTRSLL